MRRLITIVTASTIAATCAIVAACNTSTPPATAEQAAAVSTAPAVSCDSLVALLMLPHVTITGAEAVEAGAFVPPLPPGRSLSEGQARQFGALPAFCRVAATLTPSSDSDIKVEVWMPAEGWNGKLQAVGNGAVHGEPAIRRGAFHGVRARARLRHGVDRHGSRRGRCGVRVRTPREGGRLRLALGARDDGHGEAGDRGLLRRWSAVLVLVRLLGRRASGDEGSAAVPGGLRRHHRRRTRQRLDGPGGRVAACREAPRGERGCPVVGRGGATGAHGGARGVRRGRWRHRQGRG